MGEGAWNLPNADGVRVLIFILRPPEYDFALPESIQTVIQGEIRHRRGTRFAPIGKIIP